jgi:hypothetical protein
MHKGYIRMEKYTLFLNYFNKTPKLLKQQLALILKQSHQPAKVIACFFGAKNSELFQTYNDFVNKNKLVSWKYVLSNHDFKYIGRYQLALNVKTDYIIVLDDDRMPASNCFKKMIELAKTNNAIISQYGWILEKNNSGTYVDMVGGFISPNILLKKETRKILLNEGKTLFDVDYLCGGMVFHKKHLAHLFDEPLVTDKTGEDILFCLKSKNKDVKILVYLPFIDGEENTMLSHLDEQISSTLDSKKINKIRTLLINKYKQ